MSLVSHRESFEGSLGKIRYLVDASSVCEYFWKMGECLCGRYEYEGDLTKIMDPFESAGDAIENAMKEGNFHPNDVIAGRSVLVHYLESCVSGARCYMENREKDVILEILLQYGGNISIWEIKGFLFRPGRKDLECLEDIINLDWIDVLGFLLDRFRDMFPQEDLMEYLEKMSPRRLSAWYKMSRYVRDVISEKKLCEVKKYLEDDDF